MSGGRRLRVCYLVPGHGLLSTVGPSRNVLSLARALRAHAEVTLAFRYRLEDRPVEGIEVIEIEPERRPREVVDDSAMRGMGVVEFARYLAKLRRFVRDSRGRFDVLLEKSWLLSGHLSAYGLARGIPGVPVENVVPSAGRHEGAGLLKRLRVEAGRMLAGPSLRRVPVVLAETDQLARAIVEVWGVRPERVAVVPLGVDRSLFRPIDQSEARLRLGIPPDRTVLLYAGVLDETHRLDGPIEALAALRPAGIELHVLGDGPRRRLYEEKASTAGGTVILHGRVPHETVPTWIAAADLCLAPYEPRAFATGDLGYATMKVPEYLSVGRAVAGSPSERMRTLLLDGELGFLLDFGTETWRRFLAAPPTREALAAMGRAALARPQPSWDDTARGYLAACERALAATGRAA
ncbi:MAG: glycosyltransferase [Geminicoccaceae bacterium]|nr:glycosyltransferase [Geminicoccaceae bacterium]